MLEVAPSRTREDSGVLIVASRQQQQFVSLCNAWLLFSVSIAFVCVRDTLYSVKYLGSLRRMGSIWLQWPSSDVPDGSLQMGNTKLLCLFWAVLVWSRCH